MIDHFTGKPVDYDRDDDRPNGVKCDTCGGDCIDRCTRCGAPQCCPACCAEAAEESRQ